MNTIEEMEKHNEPGFMAALICCVGILVIMISSVFMLEIELHLALIIALIWTAFNAALLGFRFRDTKLLMNDGVIAAVGAIYIFMLIGVVIAALIESGTIAGIIVYALGVVDPRWFLPASLLLCSFMSLATGTSWGTVGTAGVVLVGLGEFIGIPAPMVAGAVISGALFGDKMSPLSDTTILAATAAGTEVDQHIRAMFYTTGPTYLLILIVFGVLSFSYGDAELSLAEINVMREPLLEQFSINVLVFLPLLVIITMSVIRMAAEPSMMAGTIVAVLLAIFLQDREFSEILYSLQYGFVSESGIESVDSLLTSTIATCMLANMSMGENYLAVIFGARIYKDTYEERGLHPRMLSRCVEEGATLSAGLIPWTTTGAFFSAALGVSTVEYAPWVLLSSFNIVISIGLTALGKGIFKKD